MLSKSQISFVLSLHQKKYRKEHGLFLVEGLKSIQEFAHSSFQIHTIFYNIEHQNLLPKLPSNINLFEVNNAELAKISTLKTPQGILAIVYSPKDNIIIPASFRNQFTIVLDGVQDPGNLGTIIRTADWFGFKQIICSEDTVEAFNPKTVQATMGSLARVAIYYENLISVINELSIPVYGALLDGNSIYKTNWGKEGLIILGNEGKGISANVISKINQPITIPRFGETESLNVAITAAIFCSELARNRN
ncbi:TrmH family RNA methyltransferase [Pedobacter mucosus]|uniref:TrmH family RNA methyltransferase n=1 Tax=Pedobacter mucosus TaxID=2895286 RepID=UPI001EE4876B|nr:RNA methyltransferase [Pedobacter mucosus]UKT64837.1 RNA methyltransferase [Pedobacter mucosus]